MTQANMLLSRSTGTFLSAAPVVKAAILSFVSTIIITILSAVDGIAYESVFSGIFDLAAIFAGFLSTFYIFIATKSNAFLSAISDTITFRMMKRLLKFTIIWSAIVIIMSYVLMIAPPKNIEIFSISQIIVFVWCMNVFLIAVNFLRCIAQFSIVLGLDHDDAA